MKVFFPKISLRTLLQDFRKYIERHEHLSLPEKKSLCLLLEKETVQNVFHLSFIQIFWSACVFFVDSFLLGRTTLILLIGKGFWLASLPTIIFVTLNASIKFIFIRSFAKKKDLVISTQQTLLGVIPTFGSFLLAADLLAKQKKFFAVMRGYLQKKRKNIFFFSL